jgi:hypothetical protein
MQQELDAKRRGQLCLSRSYLPVLIIHPKAPFKIFQQFCSDFLKASPHAVLFNPNSSTISAEAHLDTVDAIKNHIVHNSDAYFGEPWKRFEQTQINRKK